MYSDDKCKICSNFKLCFNMDIDSIDGVYTLKICDDCIEAIEKAQEEHDDKQYLDVMKRIEF